MKNLIFALILTLSSVLLINTSARSQNFFLADNGVTVMCPGAAVGETGIVNGVTYTRRDRAGLDSLLAADENNPEFTATCTSGITDMSLMFIGTSFNRNIGSWDVSDVTNMFDMFNSNAFNQPIGDWDVGNVTNMQGMFFANASFNQPINSWDVSNVGTMAFMFVDGVFNQDIGNWDVSSVTTMAWMLLRAGNFNQSLGTWNLESVEDTGFDASSLRRMLEGSGLSVENYDLTLQGWAENASTPSGLVLGADDLRYCESLSARQTLIDSLGWTIEGDTFDCSESAFITTWQTDNDGVSDNNSVTLYIEGDSYVISWQEVGNPSNNGGEPGSGVHTITFPTPGTYRLSIRGDFDRFWFPTEAELNKTLMNQITAQGLDLNELEQAYIMEQTDRILERKSAMDDRFTERMNLLMEEKAPYTFTDFLMEEGFDTGQAETLNNGFWNDAQKLLTVEQWGDTQWSTGLNMFRGAENFVLNAEDTPDLSLATSTSDMFRGAILFNSDINNWDVSNITDMSRMFLDAISFNQPIGDWDVSNVTVMSSMLFDAISFNQPIGDWDVGNVTNMNGLFGCFVCLQVGTSHAFNQDISGWDVSNVTNMTALFQGNRAFNQPIGDWDVSNVTSMNNIFTFAHLFNQDISNWDVSKVTGMAGMFSFATSFNSDLSRWDVSNVISMSEMFRRATSFNSDLSSWDVSNVEFMNSMFLGATSFNSNISNWDVSNVWLMGRMFDGASNFNQSLGDWNLESVEDIGFDISSLRRMLENSGLSVENYDLTLQGWAENASTPTNQILGAGGLRYCEGETARQTLIDSLGWTIEGDELACELLPAAEAPVFDPEEGEYEESVEVTITTETEGASIFVSFDGENFDLYEEPITLTETTTLSAFAGGDGFENSDMVVVTYTMVPAPLPDAALVQFIHNSADPALAEVDLYVNDVLEVEGFEHASGTPFEMIDAEVEISLAITLPGATEVILSTTITFAEGEIYTVILNGVLNTSDFESNPQSVDISLSFDVIANPTSLERLQSEMATVYLVHGSTDAPSITFSVTDNGDNTLASNISFRDVSDTVTLPKDTYSFEIADASTGEELYVFTVDLSTLGSSIAILATGFVNPEFNQNGPFFNLYSIDEFGDSTVFPDVTTSNEAADALPDEVYLDQNYPNPFNPTTQIRYTLTEPVKVVLEVFAISGQRVAMLVNTTQSAGMHAVTFDAETLSSGVYVYRLQAGDTALTKMMMLVK